MLNLKHPSVRRIEVKTTADVTSGTLAQMNGIIGIPVEHKLNGNTVTFLQEGIVALTYTGQGTIGAGSYLYWDVSAGLLTISPTAADVEVGQVLGADPSGASNLYLVSMRIGFPRAASGNGQTSMA